MRLHVSGGHTRASGSSRWFARSGPLASCFKRMYIAFSVCLELCLVQNSRSGCGLFCWSFCLWVSKRWNHLRDQSSIYSHEVSSFSLMVLCQVAEMVRMETRAVSREFSDSKARAFAESFPRKHFPLRDSCIFTQIWVAHLLKLMDLGSLPMHCVGDRLLERSSWLCSLALYLMA